MWRSCLHMPHFNYLPKAGQRQPRHARWAQPGWHEAGTAAAGEGATRFRRPPTTVSDAQRSEGERRSMATMAELGLQVARSKERVSDQFDGSMSIYGAWGFHFTH
uniref:Uncharacterized protein K0155E09.51 n=1 Tax=Oryza sativa subsp. indica TaxID=39946 RepID=C8TFJ6_ORYSI|nr:hypothetical protein [Oryza sativa Indica Group]